MFAETGAMRLRPAPTPDSPS